MKSCKEIVTLLCHYSIDGDIENVETELRKGVSPNFRDSVGWTSLHHACWCGHLEVAKYLCENGADINTATLDEGGNTPLHQATSRGHYEITRYLLEMGADMCITNCWGDSPFHQACSRGLVEIAKVYLLEYNFPIDAQNNMNGNTPLILAACTNQMETVKFLVENGATINLKNDVGDTASVISRRFRFHDVYGYLKIHGGL